MPRTNHRGWLSVSSTLYYGVKIQPSPRHRHHVACGAAMCCVLITFWLYICLKMANRSTDGFHSLHLSSLVSLRQVSSHYVNSRLCFFLSNVFFFGVTHSMSIRLFTFSCLIVPLFFLINHIFIYLMPIRRSSTSVLPQFFFLPMSHFNRFFLLSNSFICDNFSSVISFLSFAQ